VTRTATPSIQPLARHRCEAILARNHVGRIAYARGTRIEIEPIHYVYADGWIYGRTSPGAKTEMTGPGWWPVAFEVDEIESLFRWRSVLVHGGFYTLPVTEAGADEAQLRTAVELLRSLIPRTLSHGDPTPHRTVVFGIAVQEVTGREATPGRSLMPGLAGRP
jgi:uncharacterized protein